MDELVEWLRAQLDVDEASEWPHRPSCQMLNSAGKGILGKGFSCNCDAVARWYREVEAKRRRLERHKPGYASDEVEYGSHYEVFRREDGKTVEILVQDDQPREPYWCRTCGEPAPCPELRDDVSVYADRPGYRAEWRPSTEE